MKAALYLDQIERAVDYVLATLPARIVLGMPLGIGKPNRFVNALYQRIKSDPQRSLKILTALSLEKPVGKTELERRFLEPFVARVFEDYPDLDYVKDLRAGTLPPNIEVAEFFLKTGDYLGNAAAQQAYICTNYTFVARDLALHGVNLVAQAVAARSGEDPPQRLSLSSNTDVTAELIERLRALPGHPLITVGVINRRLPYMENTAEVAPEFFDLVVTDPAGTHAPFAAPSMKISPQDYAIGLHAASLVSDGGTLQIGIGALGDAIAQALIVRHRHAAQFRLILSALGVSPETRELGSFSAGLYACSEMFVSGLLELIDAGIVRREVFPDATLQRLLDDGTVRPTPSLDSLHALRAAGRISSPLTAADVEFLRSAGLLRPEVGFARGSLTCSGQKYSASLDSPGALEALRRELLGDRLTGGVILHGGFFLGPRDFDARLRALPPERLRRIAMHRIDFINQLDGHYALAVAQRRRARFMNTTMMVTLLGAAVSDALESGQVVSGVGGQYNFVAMAHALPDARSLLLLRATRYKDGEVTSNLVWDYGHHTIPRHLRDVVITEYGVADLRAQSDAEVIKRLLAITDSRFQPELLATAKRHGKLAADYELPERQRHNLPERLEAVLAPHAPLLPDFPFGTDFTDDELTVLGALEKLKQASDSPFEMLALGLRSLFQDRSDEVPQRYLERLGLDEVHGLRENLLRRLFAENL